MNFLIKNLKIFSKTFQEYSKKFQEYFPKSNHKSSQKVGRCGSCYPIFTPDVDLAISSCILKVLPTHYTLQIISNWNDQVPLQKLFIC
jgi:hypothetical protein